MKILVITPAYAPSNLPRALRVASLVRELTNRRHHVTVLAPNRTDFSRAINEDSASYTSFPEPKWGRLLDTNVFSKTGLLGRAARRILDYSLDFPSIEFFFLVRRALRGMTGFDLVISIAAPHAIHWAVASRWPKDPSKRAAVVWLADCGDPFYGLKNDSVKKPLWFWPIERWALSKPHSIAIPIEGARSAYMGCVQNKLTVIPQGFTFPTLDEPKLLSSSAGTPCFCYSGNVGSYKHYAIPFAEALSGIDKPFKFFVVGRGEDLSFWRSKLSESVTRNTIFMDMMPRHDAIRLFSSMDFLVHFPYRDPSQRSLKLIDYLYSRRPILSFTNLPNQTTLNSFLNGDFTNQFPREDISEYEISRVTDQFLELAVKFLNESSN
jgi:hypothetical protein